MRKIKVVDTFFFGQPWYCELVDDKVFISGIKRYFIDEKGNLQTQMAQRRFFRGTRRLYERSKLRRERLLRVLNILGFLPIQFREQIDFGAHPGQFIDDGQPLIAYRKDAYGKREFSFMSSFDEMLKDFSNRQPELVSDGRKVPYDWTIYYLRKKALAEKISKEELAWIILNFNAKRGYYQRGDDEGEDDDSKLVEYKKLKVTDVINEGEDKKKHGNHWYTVVFEGGVELKRTSPFKPFEIGDEREGNNPYRRCGSPCTIVKSTVTG